MIPGMSPAWANPEPCHYQRYDLVFVGVRYPQRKLQDIQVLAEIIVADVLGPLRIKLLPDLVEQVVVLVCDALLDVFVGLESCNSALLYLCYCWKALLIFNGCPGSTNYSHELKVTYELEYCSLLGSNQYNN